MFFIGKTVFLLLYFYIYHPHTLLLFHIRDSKKKWKIEGLFVSTNDWEWVRSPFFLLVGLLLFFLFCTIHSIKLEFAVNLLNNTIRFSKKLLLRIIIWRYIYSILSWKFPTAVQVFLLFVTLRIILTKLDV